MPQRKSGKAARKPARSTARTNRRIAHEARRPATRSVAQAEPAADEANASLASLAPHELYRHEKRRRADQQRGDARDPLEEARREFKAMIEAGVGTPRGGRPRKTKPQPEDVDE
jgi:hypothetical protein